MIILFAAVLTWFLSWAAVRAEETDPILTGGDKDSGYTYLIPGVGTFETNCKNGGSASFVYIDHEDSVRISEVRRDGAEYDGSDGIYLDKGYYEVTIGNEGGQGVFRFSVSDEGSSIIMSLSANNADIEIIREPEMELTGSNGYFRYTLPDWEWIEANVPQGAYTRGVVELSSSGGLTSMSGYLDGELISGEDKSFRQEGSYIITFWDLDRAEQESEAYRVDYCFRIFRDTTMNLSVVTAPKGMRIAYVRKDGDAFPTADQNRLLANRDGDYEILFCGTEDQSLSYSMSFTRNTVPPRLSFRPEFKNGDVIEEPLYFSGNADVAELRIVRDGAEVAAAEGCIKVNGRYTLQVADRAGNRRKYDFTLKNGIPLPVERMVIIPVILIIVGGVILVHSRKLKRSNLL